MRTFILAAILLLSTMLVAAQPGISEPRPTGGAEECPDKVTYTGRFDNSFGFSAIIPEGYKGSWNSAICVKTNSKEGCTCMGDHGRFIPLGKRSGIDIYATYNAVPYETLSEAVDSHIDYAKERAKKGSVKVIRRFSTRLDTFRAERIILRFVDKESSLRMIEDSVDALRSVIKGYDSIPSHHYIVSLSTPEADYESHRKVLEQVLKSWKKRVSDDGD
jgi:hypothetical protein